MSKIIGALLDFGVGKESSRGTAVAPSYWLRPIDISVDEKVMRSMDEGRRSLIEDSIDSQVVGKFAEGEFTVALRDQSIGLLLLNIFGGVSSAVKAAETIVYEHTYSVAESNQHQSLTLHAKEANAGKDYALGMLDSMELSVELEKHATAKFGFRSKVGATGSRTASYTAENIFLPTHASVKFATNQAGLDAASAIDVRSCIIKVNKNIEEDRALGSVDPQDIVNKTFSIDGELEIVYDNQDYVTQMLDNTTKALRLKLTNSDVAIGVGSNPDIEIDLNKVLLEEVSRDLSKDSVVTQTLAFKAFFNETDSKMVSVILTNLVTAY